MICSDVAQWSEFASDCLTMWHNSSHALAHYLAPDNFQRLFSCLRGARNPDAVVNILDEIIEAALFRIETGSPHIARVTKAGGHFVMAELYRRRLALGPVKSWAKVGWLGRKPKKLQPHPWMTHLPKEALGTGGPVILHASIIPENGKIGGEFVDAIVKATVPWDRKYKQQVRNLLRSVVERAKQIDPNWTGPDVFSRVMVRKDRKLTDANCWYVTDPENGHPDFEVWRRDFSAWIDTLTVTKLANYTIPLRKFITWNRGLSEPVFKPADLERHHVTRIAKTPPDLQTFVEWLIEEPDSEAVGFKACSTMAQFFDWWLDERGLDLEFSVERLNPIGPRALGSFERPRKLARSNKSVLPQELLGRCKEVLRERQYSFARGLDICQARVLNPESGKWEDRFCPVLATAVDLLLELPLRSIQVMLLDSGEADELKFDHGTKTWIRNDHVLARGGRHLGVLKEIKSPIGPSVSGFFINTNKTELKGDGQADRGYEIPWTNEYLMCRIGELRSWQETFNPIRSAEHLLARTDLTADHYKHGGKLRNPPQFGFLMREANSFEPVPRSKLEKFWTLLLAEVESRMQEEGVIVSLVEPITSGRHSYLKALYTLHGLRVAGITSFVEAGLPIDVLAQFVSGHATLMMVLHYTVSAPDKIHAAIDEAARANVELEEDLRPVLEFLRSEANTGKSNLLQETFFGSDRAMQELQCHSVDLWDVMPDGICPVGGSLCHIGASPKTEKSNDNDFSPLPRDQYNCALCRFRVSGPAFLHGQVMVINQLLYRIRQEARCKEEIDRRRSEAHSDSRADHILRKRELAVDGRIDHLLRVLGARMSEVMQSRAMLDRKPTKDDGSLKKHALITRMNDVDMEVALETEASEWDLIEFAAQTAEVFPALAEPDVAIRKARLLGRMLRNNGYEDMLLELSDDEALRAGNEMTRLMQGLITQQRGGDGRLEMRALMDCTTTLSELHVAAHFEEIAEATRRMVPSSVELKRLGARNHG